ncbi:hypothetical protein [Streptomyces sp. NPDC058657]|uniref:hypothetical protein n=1 Tax=unclassified Streptomyces TaxID=2593676 RepID=UPI0036468CC7
MTDMFLAALEQATRTVVARVRGELPAAETSATAPRVNEGIVHDYCCTPDWALCGLDLKGRRSASGGEQDCVVCADLASSGVGCAACASGQSAS